MSKERQRRYRRTHRTVPKEAQCYCPYCKDREACWLMISQVVSNVIRMLAPQSDPQDVEAMLNDELRRNVTIQER
jgi:hypothetical protein